MLIIRLSTEARCFFVVRSETERVGLRSKLGQCPKMMVGMLLESCGKTTPTYENRGGSEGRKSYCMNHPRWNHERRLRSCSCVINGCLHAMGR